MGTGYPKSKKSYGKLDVKSRFRNRKNFRGGKTAITLKTHVVVAAVFDVVDVVVVVVFVVVFNQYSR